MEAFHVWQNGIAKRLRMASVASAMRNIVTARAWRAWRCFCEAKYAKRAQNNDAIIHLASRTMTLTIQKWQVRVTHGHVAPRWC